MRPLRIAGMSYVHQVIVEPRVLLCTDIWNVICLTDEIWVTLAKVTQVALVVKNPPASAGDAKGAGSIPGLGRFPWKRAWPPTPVFLPGESPWTEQPGRLQAMGSQRARHNWSDFTHMQVDPWSSNLDCSRVSFSCFFEDVFSIMWKSFHKADHIKQSRRLCLQGSVLGT